MSQSDRANVFNSVADQHLVCQVNELHFSRDTPVRSLVLDPQAKPVLMTWRLLSGACLSSTAESLLLIHHQLILQT